MFTPLQLMEGETYKDLWVIVDECQNCTRRQMQNVVTRLSWNCKIVLIGDERQCDLVGCESGLTHFLSLTKNLKSKYLLIVKFDQNDICRHPWVRQIIYAYDRRGPTTVGENKATIPILSSAHAKTNNRELPDTNPTLANVDSI